MDEDDENGSDFHRGTFKINDVNDYPKDIRLPSHFNVRSKKIVICHNFDSV